MDKFGRRPLLLIGVMGMFISSLLIGIACQVAYNSAGATYITIIMLFVFVGSYQVRQMLLAARSGCVASAFLTRR